ncbi:MAG: carbohydrate kinase family protein [Patescibacteria group bacterium]|jgi:ribokinase
MKYDVISIGGITEDIMFHTDDLQVLKNPQTGGANKLFAFEAGDKIVSDKEVVYTFGGGGGNSAVGFARLDLKVALVGALGADPSSLKIIQHFKKEGINVKGLQQIAHYWTGLSFVITAGQGNDHVIFTHRAANDRFQLSISNLLSFKTQWYYVTSLSGEFWQDNLQIIFDSAEKRKIKVAWNPGGIQLAKGYQWLKKYLRKCDVLILNKQEAMELVSSFGKKVSKVPELLEILASLGPSIVSISDGPRGAYVYSQKQVYFKKALPFKAVNTTGAGDAFGSSLIGGLILYQGDVEKSLHLAIIRSNFVVRKIGAQNGLLTLKEAKDLNYVQ